MTSRIADAKAVQPRMVELRRLLHRHPEIGLDLPDTHQFLLAELTALGFEVEHHQAAGLTVRIAGADPDGMTSVLRADMDALPVTEPAAADPVSMREGAMHACGHDLHMAMLLGAAQVLARTPPRRDVVLAFQPGEETDRGAVRTLAHRNLSSLPGPATAFALHVNAVLPAHSINYRRDTFMAFGDWFQVDFHGPGGHASRPESAGNPIEAAAWFIQDLRALAEEVGSHDPGGGEHGGTEHGGTEHGGIEHVVATVTECLMGNTVNVIPADGRLRGTLRTLSANRRDRLIAGMRAITKQAGDRARVTGEFTLNEGYPAVISDAAYVNGMLDGLARTSLAEHVQEMPAPSMVIEDFAYFLHRWPGTMLYLGARMPGHSAFNHSPVSDVARLAGVSTATVSRALSGVDRPMSEDLRTRVVRAADELGYQVNLVGRTLRRRSSSTVGMIVPDLDNPFFSALAQALSRRFESSGIDLLLFSADSDLEIERRGVQSFLGRQVDALVIVASHERGSAPTIDVASRSVLTIELDRHVPAAAARYVGCDNLYGMQLVHDHVARDVDTQFQPVVFVGGNKDSSSGRERFAGFRRWFGDRPPALHGSFSVGWGQQVADRLVSGGMTTGTVVTAADVVALGLLSRLQTRGFRVPEDFRVIGFDGLGVSYLAHPTLTTVRQPIEKMSQEILGLVLAGNSDTDQDPLRVRTFRPDWVLGESSPGSVGSVNGSHLSGAE